MVVESLGLYKLSPLFSFYRRFNKKRFLVLIDNNFLIHDKLQVVSKELVHLADAGGDAEVNGSVADLDDESTNDIGVDLEEGVCELTFKTIG